MAAKHFARLECAGLSSPGFARIFVLFVLRFAFQNLGPLLLPVYFESGLTIFPLFFICSFFFIIHPLLPLTSWPRFFLPFNSRAVRRLSSTFTSSIPRTAQVTSPPPTVRTRYSFAFFVPPSSSSIPAPKPALMAADEIILLCWSFLG